MSAFRPLWSKDLLFSYVSLAFFGTCAAVAAYEFLRGHPVPWRVMVAAPFMLAVSLLNLHFARRDAIRARRVAEHRCLTCGYPLYGQLTRCPECGDPAFMVTYNGPWEER